MSAGMVIVGAGECGVRAALTLRGLGYEGPVTLLGAERHAPYERPPLSKQVLADAVLPPPATIASAEQLAGARIDFCPDTAVAALDRASKRISTRSGRTIAYDKLLLAVGAVPRALPLEGAGGPRFISLRTRDEALDLRARLVRGTHVVVIGGGFIGLEVAAAARVHEADVTVVEALPQVLSRVVPEELAARLQQRHRDAGVTILCGAGVTRIKEQDQSTRLHLRDGRTLDADLVVVGIGAVPETGLAAAAGLAVENGIAVDRFLCTSDPDILAAGDCCSFPLELYGGRRVRLESWRNAVDQGVLAAHNMLGRREALSAVPWFWSDQYDMTLQIAGLPDEGEAVVRRAAGEALVLFHLKADGRLVAASGVGSGAAVARDIRIAELLIARRARPDPLALAQPDFKLKSLLATGADDRGPEPS